MAVRLHFSPSLWSVEAEERTGAVTVFVSGDSEGLKCRKNILKSHKSSAQYAAQVGLDVSYCSPIIRCKPM